jgi:hypothetical protein
MTVRKVREALLIILAIPVMVLAIPFIVVFLAILPFYVAVTWVWGRWLRHKYRLKWGQKGRHILFVYSNSPNWKEYIEENWLPRLRPHAVVLNWSERSQWKQSSPFESKVFWHFAGREEFNPIAIYLPPRGRVRVVRFWQPFKDFKHGKDRLLGAAERELFDVVAEVEDTAA